MVNRALDKIRDEMAAKSHHPGVQTVGQFLTVMLQSRPETAEQILQKDKTLEGAFSEVKKYAEGHRTGNYAFVPPDKADELVRGYYGISMEKEEPQAPAQRYVKTPVTEQDKLDELDLDALLGG